MLPPSAYDFQVTLSNGKRADCLIKLPNPPGSIVVDAKFPLESYRALREAHDDLRRTLSLLEPEKEPHLFQCAVGNYCLYLCEAGEHEEAARLLERRSRRHESHC